MTYELVEMLQDGFVQLPIWANHNGVARRFNVVSSLDTLVMQPTASDDTFLVQQVQVEKLDDVRADYYLFFKIIICDGISLNRDEYYAVRTPFFDNHSYEKEKEKQQKIKPCKVGYNIIDNAYEKGYTADIVNILNNTTEDKYILTDVLWKQGICIEYIKYFAETEMDEKTKKEIYWFISAYGNFNDRVIYKTAIAKTDLDYIVNGKNKTVEERIEEISKKLDDEIDALDE